MARAFLSIPVQGGRLEGSEYRTILSALRAAGVTVVNPEVNVPPAPSSIPRMSARIIHAHNRALLMSAEFVVADISRPSLGVGYEIAFAESRSMPILALCRADAVSRGSLMIKGMSYRGLTLATYEDPASVTSAVETFLNSRKAERGSDGTKEHAKAVVQHFDLLAATYDGATEWRADDMLLQWFSQRLSGVGRCLEVGTGTGIVAGHLRNHGISVLGVDLSSRMLRLARNRLDAAVQADTTNLPFRDREFDGAALRQVLHYVDDCQCLGELYRVLSPQARFACAQVSTPTVEAAAWWESLRRITQPLRLRYYTAFTLRQLLHGGGFETAEEVCHTVTRRESWGDVYRYCEAADRALVKEMLENAPPDVVKEHRLRIYDWGLEYLQHWSMFLAKRSP